MAGWDWVTISALATGAGTLVLAIATFAAVRSANRSTRTAERSLLQGLRPLLFPSRMSDEPLKVTYVDRHWIKVPGGQGVAELTPDVIYLAMSLRNVGNGLALLHGWVAQRAPAPGVPVGDHAPVSDFRRLTVDLYVPPSDVFFWQGALRDPSEPVFKEIAEAIREEEAITIQLLYGDEEGGQRTITNFSLLPHQADGAKLAWIAVVSRHWNIDRADPR